MRTLWERFSLEEFQEDEQAEPQRTHGVPVPDGGVDQDLAGSEAAGVAEADESDDQRSESEKQMDRVDDSENVEKFAAGVVAEKRRLRGDLLPCVRLSREEGYAERESCGKPKSGAAGNGPAQSIHSSIASFSRNMLRRANSAATELNRSTAVPNHTM